MNSDAMFEEDLAFNYDRAADYYKCNARTKSETQGKCEDSLAPFSCNGPTFDHRIAPDVVAPGFFTLSANDDTKCGLAAMAGTSMATPAVAGAVALVRQYLTEGWQVNGEENKSAGFTPMGALLKAIIVNSGKDMAGSYSINGTGTDMQNTVSHDFCLFFIVGLPARYISIMHLCDVY